MGGNKKRTKSKQLQPSQKQVQSQPKESDTPSNKLVQPKTTPTLPEEKTGKRFVNLFLVYTIYKQRFRRLEKKDFKELLCHGCKGKRAAIQLCKNFMRARQITEEEAEFEKNIGFLSVPRVMPLVALLAERASYKMTPSLVSRITAKETPLRFKDKFAHLLVYGFWFLGRVIRDSLSVKEQVNRGNPFGFQKGDMGLWWAGVRILDWNFYAHNEEDAECCYTFVTRDPPKYRLFTSNAIINMGQHPLYFLSDEDWNNYEQTVKRIKHAKVSDNYLERSPPIWKDSMSLEYDSSKSFWSSESDVSLMSSSELRGLSLSRESID